MKLDTWKEKIRKQKEALSRQIEYRRLKRVRRKRTPAYTYCKNCGKSFSSIKSLTHEKCLRSPLGSYKGYHELYEGSEKSQYYCKYCGKAFSSIKSMTAENCLKHPNGNYKGKHSPAL